MPLSGNSLRSSTAGLPANFRLSQGEIDSILSLVPRETIDDIRFAQEQIRNFAGYQKGRAPRN